MNQQDLLTEIRDLKLPSGEWLVVGGAAMAARGIRDTEDIDLVVTPQLFEELARRGWHLKVRANGKPGLRSGHVEAYLDVNCGAFERNTQWLLEHSESINGIPLVDLATLAGFKASYGRAKDLRDLELIDAHLAAT